MKKVVRWLPAMVAPVVVAAAVAVPTLANADPTLPVKTPAEVLALIANSSKVSYSGTVSESSDLGLGALSSLSSATSIAPGDTPGADSSPASWLTFLTSAHTVQVYVDGPTRQRVQLTGSWSETDLIRNGSTVWEYDSSAKSATHLQLPGDAVPSKTAQSTPPPPSESQASEPTITPSQAATQLVAGLEPTTSLSVSTQNRVAGQPVYALTLTPKTTATLVDHATIAVDAVTGLPLAASIYARGGTKPAFEMAFSSISYKTPAASVFDFTPPKGTSVSELNAKQLPSKPHGTRPNSSEKPTVIGNGWTSIVEIPAAAVAALETQAASAGDAASSGEAGASSGSASSGSASGLSGSASDLLNELLTPLPGGGRGVQTALVSVLITSDGRILAGSVPLSTLEAAAG